MQFYAYNPVTDSMCGPAPGGHGAAAAYRAQRCEARGAFPQIKFAGGLLVLLSGKAASWFLSEEVGRFIDYR